MCISNDANRISEETPLAAATAFPPEKRFRRDRDPESFTVCLISEASLRLVDFFNGRVDFFRRGVFFIFRENVEFYRRLAVLPVFGRCFTCVTGVGPKIGKNRRHRSPIWGKYSCLNVGFVVAFVPILPVSSRFTGV